MVTLTFTVICTEYDPNYIATLWLMFVPKPATLADVYYRTLLKEHVHVAIIVHVCVSIKAMLESKFYVCIIFCILLVLYRPRPILTDSTTNVQLVLSPELVCTP